MPQNFERIYPESFQKSTLKLALLCVVTLGFYGNVRQYAFSKILAEKGIRHRLGMGFFLVFSLLQFMNLLFPFFLALDAPRFLYVNMALSLTSLSVNLWLRERFIRNCDISVSWFLTLIFGIVYLQFRVNHPTPAKVDSNRLRRDNVLTAAAVILALGAVTFRNLYHPYRSPTVSMEPTIIVGDRFLSEYLDVDAPLNRGDIVTFKWDGFATVSYVKRVLALGGDKVFIKGQDIRVNGQSICQPNPDASLPTEAQEQKPKIFLNCQIDEAHFTLTRDRHMDAAYGDLTPEMTIPKGFVFLVGDNLDNSTDSRIEGPVLRTLVEGRVHYLFWSMRNFQVFWHRFFKKIQ